MLRLATVGVYLATVLVTLTTLAQQTSTTAVPNLIRYSGTLKDAQSAVFSSTTPVGVTFAIYKQQDGGAPLWQETQNITTDAAGNYSVLLGSTTVSGLPRDLFSQQEQRWLGLQLQGEAEQPRVLMVSVPYAFKAQESETLGGLPASAFVKARPDTNGGTDAGALGSGPPATTTAGTGNTGKSGVGIDTVVNCATSANNYVPVFTSAAPPNIVICNSVMYQLNNNIGVGNTAPVAKLDVTGNINTSLAYQIGGTTVVNIGSASDSNLFLGVRAGANDVAGSGVFNTFSGFQAGYSNKFGGGNTFSGYEAGYFNDGGGNTFSGYVAGYNNTAGVSGTFTGSLAGYSNASGNYNTFTGYGAGYSNMSGGNNTFTGYAAGYYNTGVSNTFTGSSAGNKNTTGIFNVFTGTNTGSNNQTGSNDIYIGHQGPQSGTESSTIRIGGDTGYGSAQTAAYIAGIYGAATSGGSAVFIDSAGKLGTGGGAGGIVTSFNGRAGAVVPASGDYSFSLLSGTLGSSQFSGPYSSAVTLSNGSNAFSGSFTGSGAGLTGIQFSQLGGTLANSQFSGTYSSAVTLSNSSNVFYGNGSNLTGVVAGAGSPYYIQNGTSQQSSANFNISGNGSANTFNSATTYLISGGSILSIGTPGDANVFLGRLAGASNVAGQGQLNTFSGFSAGANNTTGVSNTFSGAYAGKSNTTGSYNAFFGYYAGVFSSEGGDNTFLGNSAGYANTTGKHNTISGSNAGYGNNGDENSFYGFQSGASSNGFGNTFSGAYAGYYSTGWHNTFSGWQAGYHNTVGNGNTFYGNNAGVYNTSGSNDIYIGNDGPFSGTESNAIRIGNTGAGSQTAAYIAGIYGSTASSGTAVYVNSNGQLGTSTSSLRFKEQVRDMGDSTSKLFQLRPVTFLYKPQYDDGSHLLQYGLIAEEVAEVYPELVAYDKDGQPYTVRYQYITTMLLNEVQKQYRRAEGQAEQIKAQRQEIEGLKQQLQVQNAVLQERLSRLERVVGSQVQTVAQE